MTTDPFLPGRRAALALLLAAVAAAPRGAAAHGGAAHGTAAAATPRPPSSDAPPARLRGPLPDARVTEARDRRRRRLVSEVIGGRVVAIDFVLTGCSSICPVISASMAAAQDLLAPRLPRDAGLLSIGLDPLADTPEALAAYAERFGAGPGWSFVNLPPAALEEVLRRLGGPLPGEDHAPMVLVLDPQRGELRRLPGLPQPETIAAAVTAALAARGGGARE